MTQHLPFRFIGSYLIWPILICRFEIVGGRLTFSLHAEFDSQPARRRK